MTTSAARRTAACTWSGSSIGPSPNQPIARAAAAKSGAGLSISMPMYARETSVPRARAGGAARVPDPLLVLPVVVVRPVVEHDGEHGDAVVRGDPQRAEVEHQVAVRLEVDDEAPTPLVRERDADRHADLRRRSERRAGMPVLAVEVPELRCPARRGA